MLMSATKPVISGGEITIESFNHFIGGAGLLDRRPKAHPLQMAHAIGSQKHASPDFADGRGLLVDRHAHVAERADDGFDGGGLREVVGQVIVDFRVGQEASFLAQLDQCAHLALALFVLQRGGRCVH